MIFTSYTLLVLYPLRGLSNLDQVMYICVGRDLYNDSRDVEGEIMGTDMYLYQ